MRGRAEIPTFRFPVPVTQEHLVEAPDAGEYRLILQSSVSKDRINGLEEGPALAMTGRSAEVPANPRRWFDRQSSCALEVDVAADCILNPKRFAAQQKASENTSELRNVPSLAAIWEESDEEDEAIVNILLAMQRDNALKQHELQSNWHDEEEQGRNIADDRNDEGGRDWEHRQDEIGDILASQRLFERHIADQATPSPQKTECNQGDIPEKTMVFGGKKFEFAAQDIGNLPHSAANVSNVTILSIEVFAESRGSMQPNPLHDPVNAICYAVEAQEGPTAAKTKERGFIIRMLNDMEAITPDSMSLCADSGDVLVSIASDEGELFRLLETVVRRWDPDFLTGFEVQKASIGYVVDRATQLDVRTSEMARLFGIDFYSVLSRGSQYRVEAVMLRVTKRKNFLLVSPSRTQVAGQAPMECIPLVMEPHSSFYPDPVVVLDFQSLYPSLIIGYNLCYSTLLGRLKDGLNAELETSLGVVDFSPSATGLLQCRDQTIIAPNGVLFCPKSYRHGVLPLILDEILSTRIMVKKSMKTANASNQERREKVLNARQLALKMISNVTYGYTAAGFSGRMPCAQLADAIVQTGRCTLEAAVRMVEGRADWNAKVVYGDTDSVFVLLKGRSKADAFRIGQEIADAVTAANPKPVTLKLEKVYMGCLLVSKKRYVGYKYESPTQEVGVIESKGLETVRRDSCGVVQSAMQASLETLFTSCDLSRVKLELEKHWLRILENRVPLKDFVFAKEVRAPPAALVSAKAMAKDPRAEPRYAERVPYVVVNGPPGARLMDLVVSPAEYFDKRARYSINCHYYINKQVRAAVPCCYFRRGLTVGSVLLALQIIPSLERLLLLLGANIRSWYANLPRSSVKARRHVLASPMRRDFRSIDSFYMSKHCRLCGAIGMATLCQDCTADPQRSLLALHTAASRHEQAEMTLRLACMACGDRDAFASCCNVVCRVRNHARALETDRVTL
ncbi:hypothetical protein BBJ28_00016228 [Nothophytophthora sp. Chile5]|nr:hypothetical protein BBJ28_00016228 [Nothophytophthora sp. Chile5]